MSFPPTDVEVPFEEVDEAADDGKDTTDPHGDSAADGEGEGGNSRDSMSL